MNVLIINCHPDYTGKNRTANILTDFIKSNLDASSKIIIKHIYDLNENIYPLNKEMLELMSGDYIDSPTKDLMKASQERLLSEWINADQVFIISPLHNFFIPSKLKDYFDNILIVNKTFKYKDKGSVGLLNNDKKVAYIQTSGSNYEEDIRYVNADHAPQTVRTLLSFMGITHMNLVRVQGLDLKNANKEEIIEQAKEDIQNVVSSFNS